MIAITTAAMNKPVPFDNCAGAFTMISDVVPANTPLPAVKLQSASEPHALVAFGGRDDQSLSLTQYRTTHR
jgi:hypothetical protein